MILLDTNVLSEIMRPAPHPAVVAWLNRQSRISVWTTSITLLELRYGLQILPEGKRRDWLTQNFEVVLRDMIERRIAVFDAEAARHAADLTATRHKMGNPRELRDTMIAGIAMASNAALATGNLKHFDDVPVQIINPWLES